MTTTRRAASYPRLLSAPARPIADDRFDLIEELGAGSTGTVWRAFDHRRRSEVALKILHQLDIGVMRRFKHEFRTLANLRHRNIVRFHELFEAQNRLFFSMELIDGVDVLSWVWGFDARADGEADDCAFDEDTKPNALTVTGPLVDEHRLRAVFAQLTAGLLHVHDAGYLHRDLKPSNLIVDREGRLRILDFGLSASLVAPSDRDLATAVGTIAYMAPEVAELRQADERSDYYSLGVLLYEALTGRPPFCGDSVPRILAAKATEDPSPPSAMAANVPADLDLLCQRLLVREPERRAGAEELRRAFGVARSRRSPTVSDTEPPARGSGTIAPLPIIGRTREVECLLADLTRTRPLGFQCRLLVGPSGIGKSAIADAFARRASASGIVLMGRCHDREEIPFRAVDEVVDALSLHLSTLRDAELARLLAAVTTPLDALLEMFPVLRTLERGTLAVRAASPAPRDPGVLRSRAFDALRELVTALASSAPTAIIIDDLHLADPDSLDLMQQVFRGPNAPPALVVGVARPGSVVDALCAPVSRRDPHLRIDLGPLEGQEAELAAKSLASYLGVPLTDARSLAIDAGGHPGFMYEILRRADDEPNRPCDSLPSLAMALGGAIADVPTLGRRVLELAALAESACSVDLAAEVLGASPEDIAAALDQFVDGNLVVATGRGNQDVFEVYHERIREVAAAAVEEDDAKLLHRALATALEHRDVDAASLVQHWMRAGDPARAAHWRTQVAAHAVASLELQRAARLHEQSLEAQLPLPLEHHIRCDLARIYGYLGRHADAAAAHLAASRLATGDEALASRHRAAEELLVAANIDAGGQLVEEVLASLGVASPRGPLGQLGARASHALARAFAPVRFAPRAEIDAHGALVVDVLATAATRVSVLDPERGSIYQQRHLRAARALGDRARYARALFAEAVWRATGGTRRRAEVDRVLAEAARVAPGELPPLPEGRAALAESKACLLVGELPRARAAVERSLAALARCGEGAWWERRQAQSHASWAYWMTGDFAALGRVVQAWTLDAKERGDELSRAVLVGSMGCQAWLLREDTATAEAEILAAERNWAVQRVAPWRWHISAARADLELYRGAPQKALAALEAAEPLARRAGLHRVSALHSTMLHLRLRTSLAHLGSQGGARSSHGEQALALCQALHASDQGWPRALASLARATLLEHRGERAAAISRYRDAEQALTKEHLGGYAAAARWRAAYLSREAPDAPATTPRFFVHMLGCPAAPR